MRTHTSRSGFRKLGHGALLVGALVSITGLCLGAPVITGIGCVTLFAGAYVTIYALVGSF